ncbi:NUDIX domain-containing protein [Curvibacter sp. HBC61]|uniref:NUDIX domain-containing protein n=1 Tax=Curvibacter cyanobacteriorum TaxID=3026422 RepID=A0ABT5N2U9_9BURK|nr:NUDIX domain-containing protein [Curvibacter sp. HBC61]MDD0840646.1 NUDIX domain-containing protein [Curvibacter sp. HBC61]
MNAATPPRPQRLAAQTAPWAFCCGHFQPPSQADLALITRALQQARQVVVGLGGAYQARSPRQPLSWGERADLILAALPERDRARLRFLPLREGPDAQRLQADWRAGLARLTQQAPAPDCLLVLPAPAQSERLHRLFRDALADHPALPVTDLPTVDGLHGAALRDAWFNTDNGLQALNRLASALPAAVLHGLREWHGQGHYEGLRSEWRALRQHRELWSVAPYPPVLVTVDAVVRCAGQVLLIRRGRAPGLGLLAVPGGFLEQEDTLLESALRELQEETRLGLSPTELQAALRGVVVLDAPERSQRGRTITHAHFFDLGDRPLPAVQGDDDAREALWVPVADLPGLEDQFFDDHFMLLDHFLGLLPR